MENKELVSIIFLNYFVSIEERYLRKQHMSDKNTTQCN